MTIGLGLMVTLACMLDGFVVMGGHVGVIWQPAEYVIIRGAATGTFIVTNSWKVIKDSGKGIVEALKNAEPKESEYLAVLGLLYSLMRELKAKPKYEVAFPNDTVNIQINETGVVFADPGTGALTQVGQIQIAAFANDAGMLTLGNN